MNPPHRAASSLHFDSELLTIQNGFLSINLCFSAAQQPNPLLSCTFLLYKLFPAGILSARSVSVALCSRTKEPASKPSLSLQGPRIHIPPQDAAGHRPKNKNTIRDKKGRKENSEESRSGVLCLVEGGQGCVLTAAALSLLQLNKAITTGISNHRATQAKNATIRFP